MTALFSEASDEACAETEAFTGCMVVFTLTDSWGDGWNGNYLVVSYGNVSKRLDLETGKTATYPLPIPQGTQVTLTYTKGPGQFTYPTENGFTVAYENGELTRAELDGQLQTKPCAACYSERVRGMCREETVSSAPFEYVQAMCHHEFVM